MTTFALLSELHRLSPPDRALVTHIIPDDGEWTEEQINDYIYMPLVTPTEAEAAT